MEDPSSRGIYLREASTCRQSTEWIVQVDAKFHEDASNFEDLVPFEDCIEFCSTEPAVVKDPDYLLLTHNGRSFNVVVDPSNLCNGLRYYEVYGIDCKPPWRGPLFLNTDYHNQAPCRNYSFEDDIPASSEILCGRCSDMPTTKTSVMGNVVSFPSPATKSFAFKVVSGQTLELVISQFWSSWIGSDEKALVDFEIYLPLSLKSLKVALLKYREQFHILDSLIVLQLQEPQFQYLKGTEPNASKGILVISQDGLHD